MKILVLNYEFPPLGGGAAPVSQSICVWLQKLGNKVTVVTMGYHGLPAYEEYEGVKIYRLKCLRTKKNVCMPWEQYSYLLAVRRFIAVHMRKHHYDICHSHFVIPTGEAARWVKRHYHIPYVLTAHGSDVEGHNKKIMMRIMHRILRSQWKGIVREAEAVTAPSHYLLDRMNNNYPKGHYVYIPNGIEWERWSKLSDATGKEKRILVMGRLQKFKNVQMILQALSLAALREWKVDILGDGPYRKELCQLAKSLGLAERVQFHGWVDHGSEKQISYVRRASVYISASRFENFSISVLEAAAAGCVLLLSDIPAHREAITDDQCFFSLEDVQTLAKKIDHVIQDFSMGYLRKMEVSQFDWKKIILQYENVLQKAAKREEKKLWVK